MRLVDQGVAVNSSRGRYRLGTHGEAMRLEVRKWKRVAELTRPWPGTWIGVYGAEIAAAIAPRSAATSRPCVCAAFASSAPVSGYVPRICATR